MLCFADLIAVFYYRRDADWKIVAKLLPSAVLGFFAALAVDAAVPRESFGVLMALCIFAGLAVMFFARGERRTGWPGSARAPSHSGFSADLPP